MNEVGGGNGDGGEAKGAWCGCSNEVGVVGEPCGKVWVVGGGEVWEV